MPGKDSAPIVWTAHDRRRLSKALKTTRKAKLYQRVLALRLLATGHSLTEASRLVRRSRQSVYNWVKRYARRHRLEDLEEAPRSGRPKTAPLVTEACILRELTHHPLQLGYLATTWTVGLLAWHLKQDCGYSITPRTLRRRMKAIGLRWKRPRYVYSDKDPHRGQKRGPSFGACIGGLQERSS
jgi:transposase